MWCCSLLGAGSTRIMGLVLGVRRAGMGTFGALGNWAFLGL
jgi:hypothetical protein